jgi:hypothetical protein
MGETASGRNGECEAPDPVGRRTRRAQRLTTLCDGFAPVLSRGVQVASPIPEPSLAKSPLNSANKSWAKPRARNGSKPAREHLDG